MLVYDIDKHIPLAAIIEGVGHDEGNGAVIDGEVCGVDDLFEEVV